ncbi:hypothetical protein GCM10007862_09630 [Dyella lipolytica]|uniref:Uncharacterized protein n=1 Tax=Dyella lipolytica TaxID=1867835 RepID=A0ABW8IY58_9GAMM|nr:hypothetical protein [Dyella lipolytica]GLQ45912.1 hypothetical protein GCM10007862_09630 [Dyella lipolytica]
MATRSVYWVALRAVLLFAAALSLARIVVSIHGDYALASAWLMPSIAGSAMAVTCFALQYQRMIPGPVARWRPPSWFENPLAPQQPLQWCLLIGEALMLSGLGCASVDMLSIPRHCSWEIPVAAGMGVWLGTCLCGGLWMRRLHH